MESDGKILLVISTYPTNNKHVTYLNKCIDSLKPLNWDIMVISHQQLDEDIQKKVNYFLYDEVNELLDVNLTPHIWSEWVSHKYKYYIGGHALSITRNVSLSMTIAKKLNYDFCYFLDSDLIFNFKDLEKLIEIKNTVLSQDKQMFFFNPQDYIIKDCNYDKDGPFFFETDIFGGRPDFILNKIKPPTNQEEWNKNNMCYKLEVSFYNLLKDKLSDLYLIDDYSKNYFNNSDINLVRYGLFVCDFIKLTNDPNMLCFLSHNLTNSSQIKKIIISENGIVKHNFILKQTEWKTFTHNTDNVQMKVEIYDIIDNKEYHIETKTFRRNKELLNKSHYKGELTFK